MTIGIAASGPQAGLAIFRALQAVEKIARGAIGGFASFAVITADGHLVRFETQRGGTATLFTEGEKTGVEPPPWVAEAPVAAIMSSGPDRPDPLSQFVAGDAGAGLVTGHRLPNRPGTTGVAVNQEALLLLSSGHTPKQAVAAVLAASPQADAGLIAVDRQGRVYGCNSARVATRPDLGWARRETESAVVEALHNSIHPVAAVASLAAEVALDTMQPRFRPDGWLMVDIGIPVEVGEHNAVWIDQALRITRVVTTDPGLLDGRQGGSALYIGADVIQDGRSIGTLIDESYVVLENGIIRSLSGQRSLKVGYRCD